MSEAREGSNSSNNNANSLQVPGIGASNHRLNNDTPTQPPMIEVSPRLDLENPKKSKTMAEFLASMDNYAPIIPDAVTDYYLNKSGFDCDDVRIKRLLALATQKFVADIATDAFQFCKVRQSGNRKSGKERKTVLTMEDLTAALADYGVNIKKPDYYS
ncbi:transcription initiation factor TFIID 23-30kDa subunit-domain-containing protein [Mucor lusitanicus]|nr:transcription initiation factor TFIID 23-30kDa subunit-domain-containing protein [Mucor lusitanicus]